MPFYLAAKSTVHSHTQFPAERYPTKQVEILPTGFPENGILRFECFFGLNRQLREPVSGLFEAVEKNVSKDFLDA